MGNESFGKIERVWLFFGMFSLVFELVGGLRGFTPYIVMEYAHPVFIQSLTLLSLR